jgi:hypothetical protein
LCSNDTVARDKLQDAVDELYGTSLDDFVSERKRLSGELKKGGEAQAAEQLSKLPKPTAAAWALNNVAREDPAAVEQWLDATSALRSATEDPGRVGGDALRAAMGAQRAATGELIDVVRDRAHPGGRPLSPAMLDRVRGLLHAAAADQAVAERLRAGRITEEKESDVPLPAPSRTRPASDTQPKVSEKPAKPSEPDPEAAARTARRADLRRQINTAREQMRRLRREATRTETAARSAEERREDARRALRRSESEAEAARESASEASAAADAADQELERLEARLRN